MTGTKTLWTQGRSPRNLVLGVAAASTASFACVDLLGDGRLGWIFDVGFLIAVATAAFLIRPQDFYSVAMAPPVLMLSALSVTAFFDRGAVSQDGEPVVQAVASGLAHHAVALGIGYVAVLCTLGLRRVAEQNEGSLRGLSQATTQAARAAADEALARAPRPPQISLSLPARPTMPRLRKRRPTGYQPAQPSMDSVAVSEYYADLLASQAVTPAPAPTPQTSNLPEVDLLRRRVELEEIDTTVYMPAQPNYDGPIRRAV